MKALTIDVTKTLRSIGQVESSAYGIFRQFYNLITMLAKLQSLLITLECWFRKRPLTLFQLCAILITHDFTFFGLLALSGAHSSSDSLAEALTRNFDVKTLKKILIFMDQYPDCKFEPVNLDVLMGSEFVTLLGKRSISYDTLEVGWKLKFEEWIYGKKLYNKATEETQIFIIKPQKDKTLPNSPTAFPLRFGGYIFLLDDPKDLCGAGKFIFMHELGHLSIESNVPVIHSEIGYLPYYLVAFYAFTQLNLSLFAFFIWVIYFRFFLDFLKFNWQVFSEFADANHEIQADFFAFKHMNEIDKKKAAAFLKKYPILDKKLTSPFDEFRKKTLQDNIDLITSGDDEINYLLYKNSTPFFIWIALAVTMSMAFLVRPQDLASIFAEFVIVLSVYLFQIQTFLKERALVKEVNARLEYRRFD